MRKIWLLSCLTFVVLPLKAFTAEGSQSAKEKSFWKTENLEKVFESAKSENKNVVVYWGAQWCPPCNAMKADVFEREEFAKATESFERVMIDGDSKDAQKWSDFFRATGYPTLLVLGKNGEQVVRFVGYTKIETVIAGLKVSATTSDSLSVLASKAAKNENLSEEQWRILALSDWSKYEAGDLNGRAPIDLAVEVLAKLPSQATLEKSLLTQYILYSAPDSSNESQKKIQSSFESLIANLIATPETRSNALPFFAAGESTLKWFLPKELPLQDQKTRVEVWSKALESVVSVAGTSLFERVDAVASRASVDKFLPIDKPRTELIRKELLKLKAEVEPNKDAHIQTSLIPELADSFYSIGDVDVAVKILKKAAAKSQVPYYFLGHLAYFLEDSGKVKEALVTREQAMNKAKGSATKIQWTWNYIKALNKSSLPENLKKLDMTLEKILKLSLQADDGFEGRNLRYMNMAGEVIDKRLPDNKKLSRSVEAFNSQCETAKSPLLKKSCTEFISRHNLIKTPDAEKTATPSQKS